jgi:hypothetical protein
MPTSIHVPAVLLEAVDRKARSLRISRNQLIVRALEREVQAGTDWSSGFLDRLSDVGPDTSREVDELLSAVRAARKSRRPRAL